MPTISLVARRPRHILLSAPSSSRRVRPSRHRQADLRCGQHPQLSGRHGHGADHDRASTFPSPLLADLLIARLDPRVRDRLPWLRRRGAATRTDNGFARCARLLARSAGRARPGHWSLLPHHRRLRAMARALSTRRKIDVLAQAAAAVGRALARHRSSRPRPASRVIYGSAHRAVDRAGLRRPSPAVVGMLLGLIAGYGPRWLDAILVLTVRFDPEFASRSSCSRSRSSPCSAPASDTLILVIVVDLVPAVCPASSAPRRCRCEQRVHPGRALCSAPARRASSSSTCCPTSIGPLIISRQHGYPRRHHDRGRTELPRPRRAAADAVLGQHPQRRLYVHPQSRPGW